MSSDIQLVNTFALTCPPFDNVSKVELHLKTPILFGKSDMCTIARTEFKRLEPAALNGDGHKPSDGKLLILAQLHAFESAPDNLKRSFIAVPQVDGLFCVCEKKGRSSRYWLSYPLRFLEKTDADDICYAYAFLLANQNHSSEITKTKRLILLFSGHGENAENTGETDYITFRNTLIHNVFELVETSSIQSLPDDEFKKKDRKTLENFIYKKLKLKALSWNQNIKTEVLAQYLKRMHEYMREMNLSTIEQGLWYKEIHDMIKRPSIKTHKAKTIPTEFRNSVTTESIRKGVFQKIGGTDEPTLVLRNGSVINLNNFVSTAESGETHSGDEMDADGETPQSSAAPNDELEPSTSVPAMTTVSASDVSQVLDDLMGCVGKEPLLLMDNVYESPFCSNSAQSKAVSPGKQMSLLSASKMSIDSADNDSEDDDSDSISATAAEPTIDQYYGMFDSLLVPQPVDTNVLIYNRAAIRDYLVQNAKPNCIKLPSKYARALFDKLQVDEYPSLVLKSFVDFVCRNCSVEAQVCSLGEDIAKFYSADFSIVLLYLKTIKIDFR